MDNTKLSLRERNKLAAMRDIQRVACELFTQESFDDVTVQAVADAAGVSPMTLYRYFGTKENLVLWDESIPACVARFAAELEQNAPFPALRSTLVHSWAVSFDSDQNRKLTRIAFENPAVSGASVMASDELAESVVQLIAESTYELSQLESFTVANTCLAVVTSALYVWQNPEEQKTLAELLEESFDALSRCAH